MVPAHGPSHVEYLNIEDLVWLAGELLGSPPPVRDLGLLESALARPRTTLMGVDAYGDIWSKAAALLSSLVRNHAMVDGNKRLGWLATAVFLEINNASVAEAQNDAVYDLVMTLAAGDLELEVLAETLRNLATNP